MREILVMCPQERDLKAIRAAGLEDRYRLRFAGSDLDQLESFDPDAFLEECETIPAEGVVGTKDQSALRRLEVPQIPRAPRYSSRVRPPWQRCNSVSHRRS